MEDFFSAGKLSIIQKPSGRKGFVIGKVDISDLLGIPYNLKRHPGNISVSEFLENPQLGSNCQLFVLGLLKRAGFDFELDCIRIGSKELWERNGFSEFVFAANREDTDDFSNHSADANRPFDIFFFWCPGVKLAGNAEDFKKLHLGIFAGVNDGREIMIIHNPRDGNSCIWNLTDFFKQGYQLFGVKRPSKKNMRFG
ncbi:MAG: hypothetical protein A3B96_00555 [Candidatus Spechtbacteria bacterium RIFCSPHIGHO2_02_FULL_43_15b]|uniref:NlpC/P60 domain-containing protein n=1 Tax=Candidatus Spechtbacteria bacterium RIFCSPHIGHO2_01_FULL_43_30 TaxID=1802158 RepID=A0A1G2H6Z0_9BACT|nr:MAG: hypothetical protein A2827_00235 [Candidatus Spechtbacteria bacterium RIFCSPHIGHO2_01_FULL_43_30]OGZ58816.1 MAG: hypothetical protein A3B96_00555 [Candidatus Spechtbacteria bacterium RIFCSPHIGHO2_02_FULL_43_15b]